MLLRKLGKRGTAIIEYVILLSFVAVIGTSFTSDAGMGGSIKSIITNVEQLLGLAAKTDSTKAVAGAGAEQFQNALSQVVDGIYDYFQNKGYKLATIKFNNKYGYPQGSISSIRYYDGDDIVEITATEIPGGREIAGVQTVSQFLTDTTLVYGRTPGETYLAFDKEGNVVAKNSLDTGNITSTLTFKDPNTNAQTQLSFDEGTKTFVVTKVDANGNNNWNDD